MIVVILLFVLPNLLSIGSFLSFEGSTSTYFVNNGAGGGGGFGQNGSTIVGSKVEITYPSDYSQLSNYSLTIINQNRTSSGLSPVTMSPIPSGQQHADSMLQYGYFSHWDTQGFKPYMRYSILNGTGFVEENVAYEFTTLPSFTSPQSVERAINSLEWQMMNNDTACCNNGHRDNILTPSHNRVSIGIAYDATHVYFVEDFETYLAELKSPIAQGNLVILSGNTSAPLNPTSVLVFYDSTPSSLSTSQLETSYYGPYGQGNFLGGVIAPCNGLLGRCLRYAQGITDQASVWQVSSGSIDIQFSLSDFVSQNGNGVYTVYLVQGNQNNPVFLTSISVFVSS